GETITHPSLAAYLSAACGPRPGLRDDRCRPVRLPAYTLRPDLAKQLAARTSHAGRIGAALCRASYGYVGHDLNRFLGDRCGCHRSEFCKCFPELAAGK